MADIRSSQSKQLLDLFHHQAMLTQSLLETTKQSLQAENNLWLKSLLAEGNNDDSTLRGHQQMSRDVRHDLYDAGYALHLGEQREEAALAHKTSIQNHVSLEEVNRWLILLEGLTIHQEELHQIRHWYLAELNQTYVRLLKGLMIALAGLLYFNSGFFAGQVFAVVVLSAFITTSISLLSWPVMLVSCAVGVAALLSVFWFSDRLDVENLVSHWIGLDIDKIHQLPDDKVIQTNRTYFENEKEHFELNMQVHHRFLWMARPASCAKEMENPLNYQLEIR